MISACIIVRDESRHLPGCLESLRPWVGEVCVVDTGSGDQSPDIARGHGARVKHIPWDDDFAAARNASLDMATGDWCLVIDADERLERGEALAGLGDALGYTVTLRNEGALDCVELPRLLRRDPRIRYHRAIHESPMQALAAVGCPHPAPSGAGLRHLGYDARHADQAAKRARNLRMLRAWCASHADDVYAWHKLAQAAPVAEIGGKLAASEHCAGLLERARSLEGISYAPDALAHHAVILLAAGRDDDAEATALRWLRTFPRSPRLLYTYAEIQRRRGAFLAARMAAQRALDELPNADPWVHHPSAQQIRDAIAQSSR